MDLESDGDPDIVGIAWGGYKFLNIWRDDAIVWLGGARAVETPAIGTTTRGNSQSAFAVTITTGTPGATIRYTLDGSEPATCSRSMGRHRSVRAARP